MTDLEITRLCGLAMGLDLVQRNARRGDGYWSMELLKVYDPLHDDAQAMAMVKKFNLVIERERDSRYFGVTLFTPGNKAHPQVVRAADDLNRAICECVAKMQAAK